MRNTFFLLALAACLLCGTARAGESVYTLPFDDPQGVFFTPEAFGIRADGKMDVSDALQEALNGIKRERGFGVLYLPEGKYRISRTIYIPDAIRLIGYGKKRPEIILADKSQGFDGQQPNGAFPGMQGQESVSTGDLTAEFVLEDTVNGFSGVSDLAE